MTIRRLMISLRLALTPGAEKRAEYLRTKKIFHSMGHNCLIMKRKIPLYPKLLSIGNNVSIASNVSFITHDVAHQVLNNMDVNAGITFSEKIGCISVGDNVFIGAGTRVLFNVKIGSNVIIATGSVITHDIPNNSVVAGAPGRVIGTFDDYVDKRKTAVMNMNSYEHPSREHVNPELIENMWTQFNSSHSDVDKQQREDNAVNSV